jgi:hypothetical protein
MNKDPNDRFDRLLEKMAPPSERKKQAEYLTPEEVVEKFRRMDEVDGQEREKPKP